MKSRLVDLMAGAVIGVLAGGFAANVAIRDDVASLRTEVAALRRDVGRLERLIETR